ncbi:uncharacterized protein BT62DRAFT_987163 [Guyanagaster necrorhizus]|uniref:F-box domain-containing protein n=1 Tax=Guyanagaster necrorhizus TaxID=856835 RepID=A0A9P7VSN2_9AGAR|nr:uncharacterized protein BT62DRAFT_987163 [Guyanagaster necrorhizus MCA 3950]KAG7445975.1 hypothetical protein BT62DRAFT_987163 [Guyanagaster necrorhizus MCA 3950]
MTVILPPELLAEIFEYETPYAVLDSFSGLWVFSRVCRAWRAAALSFPHLWSDMIVSSGDSDKHAQTNNSPFAMLKNALVRSGHHDLNVTFHLPETSQIGRILFYLLESHSYRWKDISFMIPGDFVDNFSFRGRIPVLSRLLLNNLGPAPLSLTKVFTIAPHLKEVTFSGVHGASTPLPWAQIISFTDDRESGGTLPTSEDDYVHVLQNAPTMSSLHAFRAATFGPSISALQKIRQTSLRELSVSESDDLRFLTGLELPSLDTFVMRVESDRIYGFHPNAPDHLRVLLTGSQSPLQHLTVTDKLFTLRIYPLLESIPDLATLTLDFYHRPIQNEFISHMAERNGQGDMVLLPRLKELTMRVDGAPVPPQVRGIGKYRICGES